MCFHWTHISWILSPRICIEDIWFNTQGYGVFQTSWSIALGQTYPIPSYLILYPLGYQGKKLFSWTQPRIMPLHASFINTLLLEVSFKKGNLQTFSGSIIWFNVLDLFLVKKYLFETMLNKQASGFIFSLGRQSKLISFQTFYELKNNQVSYTFNLHAFLLS